MVTEAFETKLKYRLFSIYMIVTFFENSAHITALQNYLLHIKQTQKVDDFNHFPPSEMNLCRTFESLCKTILMRYNLAVSHVAFSPQFFDNKTAFLHFQVPPKMCHLGWEPTIVA